MPSMDTQKILFVCLGNICRSPAAEGIMNALVQQRASSGDKILCDSAGIGDWNITGDPPDPRMTRHARQRGYPLSGRARQFDPTGDFHEFDYIVTMDAKIDAHVRTLAPDAEQASKIHPMADFCRKIAVKEVPDPYYGGADGFEEVLNILEDACSGLLAHLAGSKKRVR
nr:MAG: protein tyrosine phosphatase [Candidatus Kentron sp. H]VFJ90019.1 MAG: protein tyrosine phosphatase [Candidatus Kentron sp. H]